MTQDDGETRCRRCGAVPSDEGRCDCPPRAPGTPPVAPRDGDVVAGRYRLLRVLGEGGFGIVYEAIDLVLGRRVAVKLVTARVVDSEFEREARALARLRHPNLVVVHDAFIDGAQRGLVMELVDGPNLAHAIGEGALPMAERLRIAERVAAAVEHAHERGVLHGDLKPANVLLDSDGRPRVTDFGTARLVDAGTSTTGSPALTVRYAAPERLAGERLTAAADVYSLGALVFDLVAGRPPFEGDSMSRVWLQVERDAPPRLRSLVPEAPAELETLIASCLAKRPAERPPGARAVRLVLERLASPASPMRAEESVPVRLRAASAPPSTTGERRRVLVLELALRHLDDLREELADDDWDQLRHGELAWVLEAIERHGGLVHQASGASVTALFGLRGRRDNEVRRAASCALDLVASHDEPESSGRAPRRIAAALHAAHAVAPGTSSAWTLRDDVRRQGAALLEHAPEGEVLLTDDVMRAGRDAFATEPAGTLPASRGDDRRVPLHRLAPERAPDLRRLKIAGRATEMALVLDLLRSELHRRGVLVTIEGPAGIGKTRLLEEIVAGLGAFDPGVAVARAQALSDVGAPRRVFADLFASLERTGLVRLSSASLHAGDLELLRSGGEAAGMTTDERNAAIVFAWTTLLEAASHAVPIVLAVEDVHELPRDARDTLARFAEATRGLRVAWIFTHRQDFPAPWTGRPHHRPLVLGPLGDAAEADLVAELLGGPPGPRLRQVLRTNADGLALHALELARSLRDEGRLAPLDDGGWELATEELPPSCPLSLQELLAARLAPLSPAALSVLQCGAILGTEMDPSVAVRMTVLDGHDVELGPVLDELVDAELIHRVSRRSAACRFRHDLLRVVVLDGLMAPRRRVLAGHAARALEEAGPPGDLANDMARARHLAASDDPAAAIELALACADRLIAAGETMAALGQARLASETAERLRRPVSERARAMLAVASAASRLGEPDAVDLARRAVDAADATEDLRLRARARVALGRALGRSRDPHGAIQALESARELAESAGDHRLAVECRLEELGPAGTLGDTARAQAILAEADAEAELSPESLLLALRERARQLFLAGEHDEALRLVDGSLDRLGPQDRSPRRAYALAQRCPILAAMGRLAEARATAEEALALATRVGVRPTQSYLRSFLAYIALPMGDLEAAASHARAAVALSTRLGSRWDLAVAQRTHAEVLAEQGALAEARVHIGVALETARELDAPALIAAALLDRGGLLLTLGDLDAAHEDLRAVLALLQKNPHHERQRMVRAALRRLARLRAEPPPSEVGGLTAEEEATVEGAWAALEAGDAAVAAARAAAAVDEARSAGRRLDEARACLALAAASRDDAAASCRAAHALAQACGSPELACEALIAEAELTDEAAAREAARAAVRARAASLPPVLASAYLSRPDRARVLGEA